jgi:hypothetical protein
MIVILLFIVLFFVLLEIENLHWNLIESQSDIRRLSNRIYELQGAIRVLTVQKKEEKPRVKTMWISTNRDSSEREVHIEEEPQGEEGEEEQEEQEDEVEIEED